MKRLKRLTLVAVVIPLMGFLALVGRAEYAHRHGPTWRIPITGYDPRDLVHGHYLRYQYQWRFEGQQECGDRGLDGNGGFEASPSLEPGCCLCLTRTNPEGIDPPVRQVWCGDDGGDAGDVAGDVEGCDALVRSDTVMPPLRYLVPEERATELEHAVANARAELEIAIGPDHAPAVRALWLDGRPWREQLGSE